MHRHGLKADKRFFMYYTYILYSKQFDRYYIGQSEDITSRLEAHNKGTPHKCSGSTTL
jgi:predicted GIY-YIG superfamily endonuclease